MGGGGAVSSQSAAVTGDGRLVVCPCGRALNVYSSHTGQLVGRLQGHVGQVTCAVLNPQNQQQVYSASVDGTIRLWDVEALTCVSVLAVQEAVCSMVLTQNHAAYLSVDQREKGGRVIGFHLATGKAGGTAMKTRMAGPLVLSSAASDSSFAATIDRHSLFVWRAAGSDMTPPLNLAHTKPYTCLAISNDGALLAAGDASGRILVYRGWQPFVPTSTRKETSNSSAPPATASRAEQGTAVVAATTAAAAVTASAATGGVGDGGDGVVKRKPPPPTTWHWHAHAVGCLAFSPDGTFLLSGGLEGVLVMWRLDNSSQSFLPRLGGPLVGLHPSPADPAKYLVRQADNTLRLINIATLKVESSVQGLRPAPSRVPFADVCSATVLQPTTGALVAPAANAALQFFDVHHDRHVMAAQVAPRNAVMMTERFADASSSSWGVPAEPYVQHVAFSTDGSVMATVDCRPDAGVDVSTEASLKFWDLAASARDGSAAPFSLNTRVDDPHRGPVGSLAYHPTQNLAVTCGLLDGEFKVWAATRVNSQPSSASKGGRQAAASKTSCWRVRSLGGFKGLPLSAAAFSPDGSTLALAAGHQVTLWEPLSNRLVAVLPAAPHLSHSTHNNHSMDGVQGGIVKLTFVTGTPFLVAVSMGGLAVWNLLTAQLHWSHPLAVCSLAADPRSSAFAVVVQTPLQQRQAPNHALHRKDIRHDSHSQHADQAQHHEGGRHPHVSAAGLTAQACHLLTFHPSSPAPASHCRIADCANALVLFAPAAAAETTDVVSGSSCSPLLVVREDRHYVFVSAAGAGAAGQPTGSIRISDVGQASSAFTDAFGAMPAGQSDARPDVDGMDVDPGRVEQRWRKLFDAPSHALPPATLLAQAFLHLLTTDA